MIILMMITDLGFSHLNIKPTLTIQFIHSFTK